jgi:hypothetical protein
VFLLDGFDEINSNQIPQTISQLEFWSNKYENLKIIVTSRPDSGIERSTFFRVYKLAPLNNEDQLGIIKKLTTNEDQRSSLINAIKNESNKIRELLTTPLMATLLVIVYKNTQKVPEEFSEFYEDLFQTLLVRHDKTKPGYSRERKCRINERKLQEIFETFSFLCAQRKLTNLTEDDIHSISTEAIGFIKEPCEPSHFIHDIVKISCLILEEGLEYHFIHKSVREFYSARFVKNRNEEFSRAFYHNLAEKLAYSWMQELIFLSQIDKYRFNLYFLKKHIELIFKSYETDYRIGTTMTESESILNTEIFTIGTDTNFRPNSVTSVGSKKRYFRGTFDAFDCIAMAIFTNQHQDPSLSEAQKSELKKNAEESDTSPSTYKINGIIYAEITGIKQELISNIQTDVDKLKQRYIELLDSIKHEKSTLSMLEIYKPE